MANTASDEATSPADEKPTATPVQVKQEEPLVDPAQLSDDLASLQAGIDAFSQGMNESVLSLTSVLASLEELGKAYSNVSVVAEPELQERMKAFYTTVRELKDGSLVSNFSQQACSQTEEVTACGPDVLSTKNNIPPLQKAAKRYNEAAKRAEKKKERLEKSKKDCNADEEYRKMVVERDERKEEYQKASDELRGLHLTKLTRKVNTCVDRSSAVYGMGLWSALSEIQSAIQPFGDEEIPVRLRYVKTEWETVEDEKREWAAKGIAEPEMRAKEFFPKDPKLVGKEE